MHTTNQIAFRNRNVVNFNSSRINQINLMKSESQLSNTHEVTNSNSPDLKNSTAIAFKQQVLNNIKNADNKVQNLIKYANNDINFRRADFLACVLDVDILNLLSSKMRQNLMQCIDKWYLTGNIDLRNIMNSFNVMTFDQFKFLWQESKIMIYSNWTFVSADFSIGVWFLCKLFMEQISHNHLVKLNPLAKNLYYGIPAFLNGGVKQESVNKHFKLDKGEDFGVQLAIWMLTNASPATYNNHGCRVSMLVFFLLRSTLVVQPAGFGKKSMPDIGIMGVKKCDIIKELSSV